MTYDIVKSDGEPIAKDTPQAKSQPIVVSVAVAGAGGYATPRTVVSKTEPKKNDAVSTKEGAGKETAGKETAQASPVTIDKEEKEIGGPKGPEPTRFGDWEQKGKCVDF